VYLGTLAIFITGSLPVITLFLVLSVIFLPALQAWQRRHLAATLKQTTGDQTAGSWTEEAKSEAPDHIPAADRLGRTVTDPAEPILPRRHRGSFVARVRPGHRAKRGAHEQPQQVG
jgi:hypothetical protein